MKKLSVRLLLILPIIVLLGVIFLFPGTSFATSTSGTESNTLENMNAILILVAKTLSRVWIPIANFTGKLMSNSVTSGEIFGLSKYLFQARNIMRAIANFILVGVIFTLIFNTISSGKNTITVGSVARMIAAGFVINISWFMIAGLVDLSTLAMLGVSNVGTSLVKASPDATRAILAQRFCVPKVTYVEYDTKANGIDIPSCLTGNGNGGYEFNSAASNDYINTENNEEWLDSVVPNENSFSGPLMHFGITVFRFFDYTDVNTANISSAGVVGGLKGLSIGFFVKIFLMFMFITPLIALLVVNLARIVLIWIWFVTGPIIALRMTLGADGLGVGWLKGIFDYGSVRGDRVSGDIFSIKNIIGAIFAPITVLASMFFAILLTGGFFLGLGGGAGFDPNIIDQNIIDQNLDNSNAITNLDQSTTAFLDGTQGVNISNNMISLGENGKNGSFELNGDIVKDAGGYIGGGIGYLIYTLFCVGILRAIFKVGLSTSDLLSGLGQKVIKMGKTAILSNIKVPIYGQSVSLDALDKEVFKLDKIKGKLDDAFIKPTRETQARDAKVDLADKTNGRYEITYSGGARFDTLGKTFYSKEKYDGSQLKEPNSGIRSTFTAQSSEYFKKLTEELYTNPRTAGTVKGLDSNSSFRQNIISWMENGGFDLMVNSGVIDSNDVPNYLIKEPDQDGKPNSGKVTGINIPKLFSESNKVGGFFSWLLEKNKDRYSELSKGNIIEVVKRNKRIFDTKIFDKTTFGK